MRWLYLIALVFAFSSCKKAIEKIQENYIINVMVDGQWRVTQYKDNGVDKLAGFAPYTFQYHRNMTVDAINNGSVEISGDWGGEVSSKTVWADFGNVSEPIVLLNGNWKITNNTLDYVILQQPSGSGTRIMRLDKI